MYTRNIFDQCRGIPASEAARREGLELKRSGNREWACCPFHREKTASLAFDRNGRFYCFGCKEHGDAVAFVAKLHSLTPWEAAERLLGQVGGTAPPPLPRAAPPPGRGMKEVLEKWHREEWDKAKERLYRESGEMAKAESVVLAQGDGACRPQCGMQAGGGVTRSERDECPPGTKCRDTELADKEWDDVWEDPDFLAAILLKSAARDRLNQLEVRDEDEMADLYLSETKTRVQEEAPMIKMITNRKREESDVLFGESLRQPGGDRERGGSIAADQRTEREEGA